MFDGEGVIHALWSCKQLLVIWENDAELMKCTRKKLTLFVDLLAVLLTRKDRVDVDLLAMILWLIGSRRNAARLGEPAIEYNQIQTRAVLYLLEYKFAQVRDRRVEADNLRATRWIPPAPSLYKINFDGAVFSDVGTTDLGIVICDSCRRVIGSLANRIPITTSATTVEALACIRALILAKELSIFVTVFKGDVVPVWVSRPTRPHLAFCLFYFFLDQWSSASCIVYGT